MRISSNAWSPSATGPCNSWDKGCIHPSQTKRPILRYVQSLHWCSARSMPSHDAVQSLESTANRLKYRGFE
jgi:hypothetical protein